MIRKSLVSGEPASASPEFLERLDLLEDNPELLEVLVEEIKSYGPTSIVALARQSGWKALPLLAWLIQEEDTRLSEAAAEALGAIPTEEAARLLWMVADTEPKGRAKTARRSLYRLRAAGIAVDDLAPRLEPPAVPRRSSTERIYKAYVSHIDGVGSRYLTLATPMPFRGLVMVLTVVNDRVGVKDCIGRDISKRSLAEQIERLRAEGDLFIVEAEPAYVQHLIREAGALNLKSGFAYPENYLFWNEIIGEPDRPFERPIIYELLDEKSVEEDVLLLPTSADLLELPEFSSWFYGLGEMQEFARQLMERERSALVLSEWSKEAAIERIHTSASEKIFDETGRPRYKRRLEEMAYLLLQEGKEKEARQSLAVALALGMTRPVQTIPFIKAMTAKSLDFAVRAIQEGIRPEDVDYDPYTRVDR